MMKNKRLISPKAHRAAKKGINVKKCGRGVGMGGGVGEGRKGWRWGAQL